MVPALALIGLLTLESWLDEGRTSFLPLGIFVTELVLVILPSSFKLALLTAVERFLPALPLSRSALLEARWANVYCVLLVLLLTPPLDDLGRSSLRADKLSCPLNL